MEVIRDRDGNEISRSRNLRGIHSYVRDHAIAVLAIDEFGVGEGKLMILFNDGSSFETNFSSFETLRYHVRAWRNVYGANLLYCGKPCGVVSYYNPFLK